MSCRLPRRSWWLAIAAASLATLALGAADDEQRQAAVEPAQPVRVAAEGVGWPQWRGPTATGVVVVGDPPITWSETENVRWKLPLPGRGLSTPVIHGNRIFITSAVPHGEATAAPEHHADGAHDNVEPTRLHRFVVFAIDRRDGSIDWQKTVRDERPHEGTHVTGSWASNSAVTDGTNVYVSFGSRGLYALTVDGELLWEKDLGDMQTRHAHGEGSSPALHGDTLVVNWDHQGQSFLVALDKRTGKQRWKVARAEITSWSTPLIVEADGRWQVVVSATDRVRGYDLADGKVIWECGGLSRNVVASPVARGGLVFVANSYDWRAMLAIRLKGARGDITETDAVVWKRDRDTPYVPSPILYDDALCFLKHSHPVLTCVDPTTGATKVGPRRIRGLDGVFASPAGVPGRFYIPSRNGATAVVSTDADHDVLAVNRLNDSFSASPAIVGDALYLRGDANLYCIAAAAE